MHAVYDLANENVFVLLRRPSILHDMNLRTLSRRLLGRGTTSTPTAVHFHQGPQHQPVPCFDDGCPNPRLSI
jgi:hypothetical protein